MIKAADALTGAGHRVRVVSAHYSSWLASLDDEVRRARRWGWSKVECSRAGALGRYLWTGGRMRLAKAMVEVAGPARSPLPLVVRAYTRLHSELVRAILAEPADLVYGGTAGALAATAEAARRMGVPYALDLEDFHSGEEAGPSSAGLADALAARIEGAVLGHAAFLTAAGPALAEAYTSAYGVRPVPINNTFPLPRKPPTLAAEPGPGLRLYWFSQTIGPGRGLEDVVRAMGLAGIAGELHLRGRAIAGYMTALCRLGEETAPRLKIVHLEPAAPDAMIELCGGYDVGLALEQGHVPNRALCLTNKALTYLLAGLAVVLTDTRGQRPLAHDLGEGAILYAPGDVPALAVGLRRWADDRMALARAKVASWTAANRRWHWDHPLERGALMDLVAKVLDR
jgi:hypothetical protein